MGPAEKLLDLILNASAHLWHNRPGVEVAGVWHPARGHKKLPAGAKPVPIKPGLHVAAAERLYARLLDIYKLNTDLMAHFASYALTDTDWRDLKVACAALMLVQSRSGQPVKEDDGSPNSKIAFYDDDLRALGEAMLLHYAKKSTRMMTPKAVLRIAELLETPAIAALNKRGLRRPCEQAPAPGPLEARSDEVAAGGPPAAETVLDRLADLRHGRRLQIGGHTLRVRKILTEAEAMRPDATRENAEERVITALEAAGAHFYTLRRLAGGAQLEVSFEYRGERFITVVHTLSLQVIDAGICLVDHADGGRADEELTLESLPSVIKEAMDSGLLVITRRA